MLTERQFLVQDDPKIPDRSGEEKVREFSRKGLRVQLVQLLAGAQPNTTYLEVVPLSATCGRAELQFT